MAGDLPFEELLVIHHEGAAEALAAPGEEVAGARVLQRFGDRVEIRMGPADSGARMPSALSEEVLEGLSVTERLGVEALRLRTTEDHRRAKANRPRDGELWDMPGCAGAPAPPSTAMLEAPPVPGLEAAAPGTSTALPDSSPHAHLR